MVGVNNHTTGYYGIEKFPSWPIVAILLIVFAFITLAVISINVLGFVIWILLNGFMIWLAIKSGIFMRQIKEQLENMPMPYDSESTTA